MNGAAPSVTVVVPTYNRANYLAATIESILAQTLPPSEILIIDDGSSDDTPDICRAFPAPVRTIMQENRGLSAARNRGIEAATSDWIAFCDSDDLWHRQKLEKQLATLRALPEAGWCVSGCSLIDPAGAGIATAGAGFADVFPVFREHNVSPENHFGKYLLRRSVRFNEGAVTVFHGDAFRLLFAGNIALPSSAVVARSLFADIGMFDPSFRVAEETEFFHRLAARSHVAIVMEPLVQYRVGHTSIVNTPDRSPLIENALRSLEQAAKLRPQMEPAERGDYHMGVQALYMRLAHARFTQLDGGGTRAALRKAWHAAPGSKPRIIALLAGSLLPGRVLRGLHSLKRAVARYRDH